MEDAPAPRRNRSSTKRSRRKSSTGKNAVHGETTVTTKVKRRGKKTKATVESETLDAIRVATRFSKVSYGIAFTKGLPDYSSVKCDIHISLPCDEGKENSTFVVAREWAIKRLKREIKKTMEALEEGLLND